MIETFRLLIGSVGDDSHSVGMALLEIAFQEAGFVVTNLGILNQLEDFFIEAPGYDAIFISCMNGHVDMYLEEFPFLKRSFEKKEALPKVWYLGGNLSVQEEGESLIRKYRRMGFDFVSPKPISCEAVMDRLYRDFYNKKISKKRVDPFHYLHIPRIPMADGVDDVPLTDEAFQTQRLAVLDSWPTGKEVWDADIKKNHSDPLKNFHHVLQKNRLEGTKPLVQPRTGVAHVSDEIEILRYLRLEGLDISSIQLDAASRKNMYHKAQEGVDRTEKGNTSFLNGYPVPVHGVRGIEEIVQAIDTPFQIRAGSPDHRLVYEIGLAGGTTSIEGGFICYLYPYDKSTSPVLNLQYWKYVDKLAAWYDQQYGVIINREYFGPLTCCLIEPSLPICINIVQALLSARAGVRSICVGLAEQGNRWQDIAAIRVLEKMTLTYLNKFGFNQCSVTTVFHHYMAAFPTDVAKSEQLILQSSVTGTLAKAHRFMTKTPVESHHIPTYKDNGAGLNLTHRGILMAANETINEVQVNREMILLEREVTAIMSAIQTMGQGSMARGTIRAFEKGILDIPFSPSKFNRNNLHTAKDCDGAIRFVNPEVLPFDNDIIDFHKELIHKRMTAERATRLFEVLEKDLTRIWKNDFLQWPLNGHYVY